MTISCIVVDDEPLARKGLREYIADTGFLQLAGEFDNALRAGPPISRGEADLLFLDIQMPRITGIEFFKTLQNPPPVIFTTAFPQYALEGFEVNALDYLVKPISFERFLKAAMKAKDFFELRERNRGDALAAQAGYFFIKADNMLVKLNFSEILFVEALQNYVMIHTLEKKYMTYLTFRSVEEYLPAADFIKTHKSFIAAAAHIDSIEGNEIRIGIHRIPISRNMKEEVMDRLLKGKFLKR